jgi:hypothetical protein
VIGEERGRALLEASAGYRAIVTRSDGMSMTIG